MTTQEDEFRIRKELYGLTDTALAKIHGIVKRHVIDRRVVIDEIEYSLNRLPDAVVAEIQDIVDDAANHEPQRPWFD
jgi:hypothetical protein